jgi:predicted XRE-type DNA-binding protein
MLPEMKPIPGFDGYYVSENGKVFSTRRPGKTLRRCDPNALHELTPRFDRKGYLIVTLQRDCRSRHRGVHHLVALAYCARLPNQTQVRHLDGIKTNVAASNLAWGTAKDNSDDKRVHGTMNVGERNGMSRLTDDAVRQIKSLIRQGVQRSKIADGLGVPRSTVSQIALGRAWAHVSEKE